MTARIPPDQCLQLLQALEVGKPVAEDDNLLFESRVETSVFAELILDRVDIVRGTKGSGKSALYRLVADFLSDHLYKERGIVIIKAVETKGDPIFLQFRDQFDRLDEIGFESFWRIYFISLITSQFLGVERFKTLRDKAKKEVALFRKLAVKNGFPIKESMFSIPALVGWALSQVTRVKRLEVGVTPEVTPTVAVELEPEPAPSTRTPVFVAELHEALVAALTKMGVKLWIMVDRLDEAFLRRTKVEQIALRGLLRSTLAFRSDRIRLKVFLRDDIFESITEVPGGFVAMTHVMSRCSQVLRWEKGQILELITNRVFTSGARLTRYFQIDLDRLKRDEAYRLASLYKIFPEKLKAGTRQSSTLDWLYKHCEDGNGVVTPRDVIDLITSAKHKEFDIVRSTSSTTSCLLSPAAVLAGHQEMSKKKRDTYLKAEFDHFWGAIEKLKNQKSDHDETSLRRILGENFDALRDLVAIGFLKHNPRQGTYSVPFLYRPGLEIRQGRSAGSGGRSGRS